MNPPLSDDALTIERHGEVTVIVASPVLETMEPSLIDGASSLVLDALKGQGCPIVVVDLSSLNYFGSSFLGLLIRCWKLATLRGGTLALSGVSPQARELLHITSLDMVWPIYADRREAVEALESE